mgnify:CR=1 FL=1
MAMTERKPPLRTARWLKWRPWVQFGFLFVWLDPLMLRIHSFCGPVFHCYACPLATFACPIGIIANFSALHLIPFIALGTLAVISASVGAFICGWVCPFGWLQDMFARIPTPKVRLPRWAGHSRYVVLVALVIVIPFVWGDAHPLFICRVCPAGALEAAVPSMAKAAAAGEGVAWPNTIKISVTVLFLLALFFTWRPWCTLLCPLGAIYGLSNRFSGIFLRVSDHKCVKCGLCRKLCKYGVLPDKNPNDTRCVRCLECTKCGAITVGILATKPSDAAAPADVPGEDV